MSYSYKNKSGKLVSGAAANSHKVYKIHGGPGRQFVNITAYALSGLVVAKGVHDGVKLFGELILEKHRTEKGDDSEC